MTFTLNHHFDKKNETVSGRRLKEFEYTELFEEVCGAKEHFEAYSIGMRGGENALSGPGLAKSDESDMGSGMGSIQFGGGKWATRLSALCKTIVFDLMDETEVYKIYRKEKELSHKTICRKPHSNYNLIPFFAFISRNDFFKEFFLERSFTVTFHRVCSKFST